MTTTAELAELADLAALTVEAAIELGTDAALRASAALQALGDLAQLAGRFTLSTLAHDHAKDVLGASAGRCGDIARLWRKYARSTRGER